MRRSVAWVRFPMTQVTQMTQEWSMAALFAWVRFRFTEDANDAGFLMVGVAVCSSGFGCHVAMTRMTRMTHGF